MFESVDRHLIFAMNEATKRLPFSLLIFCLLLSNLTPLCSSLGVNQVDTGSQPRYIYTSTAFHHNKISFLVRSVYLAGKQLQFLWIT